MTEKGAKQRLAIGAYLNWQFAGGPNECRHGYAEGIPCRSCDEDFVAALPEAKQEEPNSEIPEEWKHLWASAMISLDKPWFYMQIPPRTVVNLIEEIARLKSKYGES